MRPLDFSATSAIAGEGAAFFVLQPESSSPARYGLIEEVEMGHLRGSQPKIVPAQAQILACEGHSASGQYYRQQLPKGQPVACYSPLYGASPVTQAFDLAVGALSLQQGTLFPSADSGGAYYAGTVVGISSPCRALSCLRFGFSGEYGAIHLACGGH